MADHDCPLCWVLNGDRPTPFEQLLGPQYTREDQILHNSTRHAFAMVDVAPIGPGHSLIVTSEHCLSMAEAAPRTIQDVTDVMQAVGRAIARAWRLGYVFFEHGQRDEPERDSGCGIAHAHVHAVGTSTPLALGNIADIEFRPHRGGLHSLRAAIDSSHYLYVEDMLGNAWVAEPARNQSQVLRRHFTSSQADDEGAHWRWPDQLLLADELSTRERVTSNLRGLRSALKS